MYQVRFHGRGGQGVVTAAELLSITAFREGHHAQAFPSFGSERMGAPVAAFCRIDEKEIRSREPIANPDALIVQDSSLIRNADLIVGTESAKFVLINSVKSVQELNAPQLKEKVGVEKIITIPATEIAMDILKRNVPNVIMLSAFGALSGLFKLETLDLAVRDKFKGKVADLNIAAANRVWEMVKDHKLATPAKVMEANHA